MCLIWIGTCVLAAASLADPDASPSLTAFQLLHRPEGVRTCEPIRIEMCQGIGYNVTGVPNLVGHETQSDAELQLRTFLPLIQYGCSPDLRFFLCTVYTPMCTEKVAQLIGPCQSVCESVRSRCQPVLQRFGFSWPPALNCSRFHGRNSNGNMCMGETLPDKDVEGDGKDPSSGVPLKPEADNPQPAHPRRILPQTNTEFRTFPIDCDDQGLPGGLFVYVNRTRKCALLCDKDFQFTEKDKRLVDTWLIIWATIGLISAAFVFLTYLVDDTRRFGLDGRHLVTMSSCYGMCCVAYLIRGLAGRRAISCVSVDPFPEAVPDGETQMVLAQEGTVSADCTCLFVLYYYFATAGVAWWLVITFNFLLTSGLDWSGDASQRLLGTVFHIGAWTVPAVQTVVILIRKNIQPSELTGMCHVTSNDPMAVVGFQLAPLIVYSLLGIAFLLGGYLGAYSRKKSVKCIRGQDCRRAKSQTGSSSSCSHLSNKSQTKSTPSSEDPIVNVVVLSLLCLIPLVVNIACILFGYITISSPIVSRVNKMDASTTTVGFSDRPGAALVTSASRTAAAEAVPDRVRFHDPDSDSGGSLFHSGRCSARFAYRSVVGEIPRHEMHIPEGENRREQQGQHMSVAVHLWS